MTRASAGDLEIGARLFGQRVLAEEQDQELSQGKDHEQAQQALRLVHLGVEAPQSQVALPIAETMLDLHALAIQADDLATVGRPA
jgi:hypothetical protein